MVAALEQDEQFDELCHAAIQAQSLFERTKKEEGLGIISFENAKLNYNQVTYQILNVVENWERGKNTVAPAAATSKKRTLLYVGIGVAIIVIAGIFALRNINSSSSEGIQSADSCPAFKTNSLFNVLIFRYLTVGSASQSIKTHKLIEASLGDLREQHHLGIDIGIFKDGGNDDLLPVDVQSASNLAESCRAKLVIFGTEEPKPEGAIITTRYKFLNLGEQFHFVKLKVNERTQVDTVTSLSSITTSGEVVGNIEQQLLQLLIGVVAFENNEVQQAIDILQQAAPVDSGTFMLRNMVLADAYIKNGQNDAALNTYDAVLTEHPNYNFALENRAALLYQQGDYLAAIQDYNTRLDNSPGDISTLTQRGVAHLKAENFEEARQDLEKVQKENPEDSLVREQLKIVRQKLEEKREEKAEAEQKLRTNPKDLKALTNKADAAKSLGNYNESLKAAEQLIRQDPSNIRGYATLIEIYTALNLPEKVDEVKKRMQNAGITKSEAIRKIAPKVRELIRRDSVVSRQQ